MNFTRILTLIAVFLLLGSGSSASGANAPLPFKKPPATSCKQALGANTRPEFEIKLAMLGSEYVSQHSTRSRIDLQEYSWDNNVRLTYLFDSLKMIVEDALSRYYLNYVLTKEQRVRALAANNKSTLSNTIFLPNVMDEGFRLRPLSSVAEHYHNSARYGEEFVRWRNDDKAEQPNEYFSAVTDLELTYSLTSGMYRDELLKANTRIYGDDSLKVKYTVGNPWERSVYYESNESRLESSGYAVRVKEWRQPHAPIDSLPEKRQIMIKKVVGQDGPFLNRNEYSQELDVNLSVEEIDLEVQKYVEKVIDLDQGQKLSRKKTIHTERYGVPLIYRRESKEVRVGFVSFDKYRKETAKDKWFYEIEIEIFPEYRDWIGHRSISEEFYSFVEDMMTFFNARPTDLHKHQVEDYHQIRKSTRQSL